MESDAFARHRSPEMATFVRFHCLDGLFTVASDLAAEGALPSQDLPVVRRTLEWFAENLPVPDRFVRTTSKGAYRRPKVALCWFRDDAIRHVKEAWVLARTLQRSGVVIEFRRSLQPGFITYEDRYQVAAIPFADR